MLDSLFMRAASSATHPVGDGLQSAGGRLHGLWRELWNWVRTDSVDLLAGLVLALLICGTFLLARKLACRKLERGVIFGSWLWILLTVVERTRTLFAVVIGLQIAIAWFGAPGNWAALVRFLFVVAATVQGALWAQAFLVALIERRARPESDPGGNLGSAYGLLRLLISIAVWIFAIVILLDNLGVNVTALIAGLGIGGIAIGLAAQGIFSDLIAALSILFDQPFRRGDSIQLGGPSGVSGTVEEIGLKSTRLRAASGEMVILSNANILSQQINNLTQYDHRRVVFNLSVIYQTPPDLLISIPTELRNIVESRPRCTFDRAHFINFGAYSLDFELVFLLKEGAFTPMMEERHAVGIAIIRRFAELGVTLAYPSQTSFLAGPDGQIVAPAEGAPLPAPPVANP